MSLGSTSIHAFSQLFSRDMIQRSKTYLDHMIIAPGPDSNTNTAYDQKVGACSMMYRDFRLTAAVQPG